MKMNKRKVLVIALAICLIAIISMGTLAWFNAADEVTNEFYIADSDNDGIADFKVDVWETDPETGAKDPDGVVTYEKIAPGDVLPKNPTVENLGDYDQWIRVYVTFDEWSTIKAACQRQSISTDLRTWLDVDSSVWYADDAATTEANNSITYVYYYRQKLTTDDAAQTVTLFNNVTIPGEFEQQDMQYVSGNFTIKVKAEALQADNTGADAYAAFSAYWNK
ncbi:MAG: SipW-dependent-type signal peptide-containing protein [Clostridia bacterium]|nr:SipW-dependent-type signal peptide-containing protein [Clostridia bacterium]